MPVMPGRRICFVSTAGRVNCVCVRATGFAVGLWRKGFGGGIDEGCGLLICMFN